MNLNKLSRAKKITLILIFGILPFGLMKTDYYFMSPGPPYQWDIEINDQEVFEFDGNLYQLTVRRDEANYFSYAWGLINDNVDLFPREVILPKGVTPDELSDISLQNMKNSENVAIAVALESLGYQVDTEGDGVLVVGLMEDSPVKEKLIKNDLIVSINSDNFAFNL